MSEEVGTEHNEPDLDDTALEALAASLETPPPAELRERVLHGVGTEMKLQRQSRQLRRWRWAGVAGGAALAASVFLGLLWVDAAGGRRAQSFELADLEQERAELRSRLDAQKQELALVGESLDVQTELVRILAAPRLLTATLTPRSGNAGHARVLLDPDSGAVAVIGKGLPPPQSGRVYELWALRDAQPPVSAGRLEPEESERSFALRLREVEDPAAVTEFVVSIEPEEGAPGPTGPIVLAGAVLR